MSWKQEAACAKPGVDAELFLPESYRPPEEAKLLSRSAGRAKWTAVNSLRSASEDFTDAVRKEMA